MKITKNFRIKGSYFGYKNSLYTTLEIELTEKEEGLVLSICGNIWNQKRTDCIQCGQIEVTLRKIHTSKLILFNGNISEENFLKLLDIWDRWHLNDLNAGCIHQRDLLKKIINHDYEYLITLPEFNQCSKCGYKYGSAWLFEKLPKDIIQFIKSLED